MMVVGEYVDFIEFDYLSTDECLMYFIEDGYDFIDGVGRTLNVLYVCSGEYER